MPSDLPLILSGSALTLGLIGSALASGLETGFYVLDPVQLRHRALGGDKNADNPADCLPSCCCSPTA